VKNEAEHHFRANRVQAIFKTSDDAKIVAPTFMHDGVFTNLDEVIRSHLSVLEAARNYTPAGQNLAADLSGPTGPIDPILNRIDPILANPIPLTNTQIADLIAFVRYGLLDPRAKPANLRSLVPSSVPSGRPMLKFEFP
jgi:cytochrome c peroxidase